jgi:hypothetical protein
MEEHGFFSTAGLDLGDGAGILGDDLDAPGVLRLDGRLASTARRRQEKGANQERRVA